LIFFFGLVDLIQKYLDLSHITPKMFNPETFQFKKIKTKRLSTFLEGVNSSGQTYPSHDYGSHDC